jgi:hypothetical protein
MANNDRRYAHHYEVPFLDDLHNYFPAILYEPEAFGNVQDLLHYVRSQMQRRFNLFSAGQAQYAASTPTAPSVRIIPQPPVTPAPRAAVATAPPLLRGRAIQGLHAPAPLRMSLFEWNDILGGTAPVATGPGLQNTLWDSTSENLLRSLLGLGGGGASVAPPMEPVVVRPSQAQIDAGSTIEIVDSEEEMCAICQDQLPAGSEARTLTACDHRFHVGCIDTWFQRDVHCPVCRHDVRDATAATT